MSGAGDSRDGEALLALRQTLLALLDEHFDRLEIPAGASAAELRALLGQLAKPGAFGADPLPEVQTLAGLLCAYRGPTAPLLERLRAHRMVLAVPGGAVLLDFALFRDLQTIAQGAWEPENLGFMKTWLRRGDVVLDVGAHVGHFSILAASLVGDAGSIGGPPGGRVLAFEPAPSNLARLERNLALSSPRAPVEVIPRAAGSAPGQAQFFDDGGTGGTEFSMFAERHGARGVAFTAVIDTVDAACAARGLQAVDFVKIDVEGAELEVLAGAEQTLSRSPRATLLIELHPWVVPPEKVIRHLATRGFALGDVKAPRAALSVEAACARFAGGGDLVATRAG